MKSIFKVDFDNNTTSADKFHEMVTLYFQGVISITRFENSFTLGTEWNESQCETVDKFCEFLKTF